MIGTIRQARALLNCNDNTSVAQWRKINEEIWDFWSKAFPAYVKQRHYCRGLNAFVVWSANDIGNADNNQQWLDVRRHADRAPIKTGRHNDNYT
eukprot:3611730-Pyramimonas_sp.AAC.1